MSATSESYIKTLSDLLQADTTNKTRDALLVKLASDKYGDDLQDIVKHLDIDTSDVNTEVTSYIETEVKTLKTALGNPITTNPDQQAELIKLLTESATKIGEKTIIAKHAHIDKIIEKIKTLNGSSDKTNPYDGISAYNGNIGKNEVNTTNAIKSFFSNVTKVKETDPLILDFDKKNTEKPFRFLENDRIIGDGRDRYSVSFDNNGQFVFEAQTITLGFLGLGGKSRKSSKSSRKSRKSSKSSRKSRKSRR